MGFFKHQFCDGKRERPGDGGAGWKPHYPGERAGTDNLNAAANPWTGDIGGIEQLSNTADADPDQHVDAGSEPASDGTVREQPGILCQPAAAPDDGERNTRGRNAALP